MPIRRSQVGFDQGLITDLYSSKLGIVIYPAKRVMRTFVIYAIAHTSGNSYIGSSINVKGRWKSHRYRLKKGTHHCAALQKLWTEDGPAAFEFSILGEYPFINLNQRSAIELSWIINRGILNAMTDHVTIKNMADHSEAHKQIQSAATKAKMAADEGYRSWLRKRGEAIGKLWQSREGRSKMAEITANRWKDPEQRAKLAQGLINRWAKPENRKKAAERMAAYNRRNNKP